MKVVSQISIVIFSTLIFLSCSSSKLQKKENNHKKPNIVFIFADDLGWTDVSTGNTNGSRSSTIYETPVIDKLAAQGMSFTNAYTNQFDVLKTQAYQTALVGKSHGTPHPLKGDFGIDLPADIHHIIAAPINGKRTKSFYLALNSDKKGWTFNSEFVDKYANPYDDEYINTILKPFHSQSEVTLLKETPKHLTDAIGDFSVDYIKEKANGENPFGRKDLTQKYLKRGLKPKIAEYASMIELLDQNVGKINNALE